MIATGALAFANARVRARKSRLHGPEVAGRAIAGLVLSPDERLDPARGFDELIEWYALVLKSYPTGRPLVLALLRLLEIENIKLLWRAIANRVDATAWSRQWHDFGRLASITLDQARECQTLSSLVDRLRHSPYASIAETMWRAHAADLAAAESGFDKWASQALIDCAAALSSPDHTAAALATSVAQERHLHAARRGDNPRHAPAAELIHLRQHRRLLCHRAFRESPYCISPAVALLLLKEEEVRALEAIAVFDAAAHDSAWLAFALAASELGA